MKKGLIAQNSARDTARTTRREETNLQLSPFDEFKSARSNST